MSVEECIAGCCECGCEISCEESGTVDVATGGGIFFFKQKTAYEIVDCDWSSDVCSSDLLVLILLNLVIIV